MFGLLLGIVILGGGSNVNAMPTMYWDNFTEIYCEDLDPSDTSVRLPTQS